MPKFSALSALVWQPRVKDSLGCRVSWVRAFDHGGDPDDPRQFTDIFDLYSDHGPRRPLDVRVRRFYIKDTTYAAGHDGQCFCCAKLDVKV